MTNRLKRIFSLLTALILAFSLSSCSVKNTTGTTAGGASSMTLPLAEENAPLAPYGDKEDSEVYRASIYYASSDGSVSVPSTRVLWLSSASSIHRRLAEELMKTPGSDANAVVQRGSRIASVENSGNIVTVNVLPAGSMSDAEIKTLTEAMSKTMFELPSVTGVTVLLSGRAASFSDLPIGLITKNTDVSILYDEAVHYEESGHTSVSRRISAYYPSIDETCVIPCEMTVSHEPADPAKAILRALGTLPNQSGVIQGVPGCENMFEKVSRYEITPDGERILHIFLTSDAFLALNQSGHDRHMYLASIVLTLTSFLADTDGVCLSIGGKTVTEVPVKNGAARKFPSGIMRREDFAPYIGKHASLYFANENNMLEEEIRALPLASADSARARICALIEGPESSNLLPIFPLGVKASDILGIDISGSVVSVNLSANVYRMAQSFSQSEEELFVFGLINTLSELRGVSGLRLYFEGVTGSVLTHKIYLEGVILKNPGRIQTPESSASN